MAQSLIVTRFPPSPTGYLHIGGARTALFNWLYARQNNGKFILRIEDTDQARSTDEATRAIVESMEWLGLDWDEGPYFQSRRYEIYNAAIDRLVQRGEAYYCRCSPEELEARRRDATARGLKPKYDGRCRELGLGPEPGSVVRLKTPLTGTTLVEDRIKGSIRFENEELDDLILRRSDGSPTYHMAVVADDIDLGVTHVIRGDDHVNNTPRQILIYRALGEPLPVYAHVPMILGPDKTRLSKRHGAMSVLAYRDMGYLPHALINALARLGWSHGDQEKFTREELVRNFSLANVGKSAGVFNMEKLRDLNAWYIRETPDEELARALLAFLKDMGYAHPDEGRLKLIAAGLKPRSATLVEMAESARIYLDRDITYEEKAAGKFLTQDVLSLMQELRQALESSPSFHRKDLEAVFEAFIEKRQVKLGMIAQPLRVALTGKTASPGIFEVMEALGRESVLERMDRAADHIRAKA